MQFSFSHYGLGRSYLDQEFYHLMQIHVSGDCKQLYRLSGLEAGDFQVMSKLDALKVTRISEQSGL